MSKLQIGQLTYQPTGSLTLPPPPVIPLSSPTHPTHLLANHVSRVAARGNAITPLRDNPTCSENNSDIMTSWLSHVAGNRRQIHQRNNIDTGPRQTRRRRSDRRHERLIGESPETKDKRKCAPGGECRKARERNCSLMTLYGRHATVKTKDKDSLAAVSCLLPSLCCPTVANDAANGHLCDIYDIYFNQRYWGISSLIYSLGRKQFSGR